MKTEVRMRHRDGTWHFMESTYQSLPDDPNVGGTVVNSRDVTERRQAEEALRESEARYRALVEQTPAITYIEALDEGEADHNILYVSPQVEELLGYSQEEWMTDPELFSKLVHPDDKEWMLAEDARTEETGEPFSVEYRNFARDGRLVWLRDEAVLVRDEGGTPLYWLGVQTDVTERKQMEEKLQHRALHDPLTGLPNRDLLIDRLGRALAGTKRSGCKVAVLFMDLDNFKYVNDSLGHEAGDELLVGVAERLRASLRPGDSVARLGGDEFVVLLEDLESEVEAEAAAARLTESTNRPFYLSDLGVFVTFSIGIAMNTPDEFHHDDLLRRADVAMYRAKSDGKDRHRVFDASMDASARVRLELASDLRRALQRDELPVHYQPIVSLEDGRIVAFEALVRWEHPRKGLILPPVFVPVAEETGLIILMGRHTLREACRRSKEWQGEGHRPLTMNVNLSVRQLQDPDILTDVSLALEESGLAPRDLILEITESVLMGDVPKNAAVLRGLKALGVRIAIDDFGTGYSSLSYLERFPEDVLKVDRSFVGRLGPNADGKALVCAVIELARALGLDIVAEGVETAEQADELARLGCEVAQGYHFARPLAPEAVSRFLLAQSQLL